MSYLARWRMFRARLLLRESELPLGAIAEQVRYRSAANVFTDLLARARHIPRVLFRTRRSASWLPARRLPQPRGAAPGRASSRRGDQNVSRSLGWDGKLDSGVRRTTRPS